MERRRPQQKNRLCRRRKSMTSDTKQKMMTTEEKDQILCDFEALVKGREGYMHDLFNNVTSPPQHCSESALEENDNPKSMWFACVLWNCKVLKEFELHEEMANRLYSTLSLGKLFATCVQEEHQSWPGIHLMDWRRPFILLDIIDDCYRTCGAHPCLRVQETPTGNMVSTKPKLWDLVIFQETKSLANEITRRFRDDAVKTTVMLWGCHRDTYPEPWIDGQDEVLGEILFRPQKSKGDTLLVLIFHRENISENRCMHIQSSKKESELWGNFQDPSLKFKWFSNSQLAPDSTRISHFSLHAVKYYSEVYSKNNLQVIATENDSMANMEETIIPGKVLAEERNAMGIPSIDDEKLEKTILTEEQTKNKTKRSTRNKAQRKTSERSEDNGSGTSETIRQRAKFDDEISPQNVQQIDCNEDSQAYRFTALLDEL